MISVDLEKAFNRMDHQTCLTKLAESGASNQTLGMAAAFLEKRKMRIKLPGTYSTLKNMPGGAPQGTKCGNYLFCITAAGLAKSNNGAAQRTGERSVEGEPDNDEVQYAVREQTSPGNAEDDGALGLTDLAERIASAPSSPLGGLYGDARWKDQTWRLDDSDDEWEEHQLRRRCHQPPPRWVPKPLKEVMFVDDWTGLEKCDITGAASTFSTRKEERMVHAAAAEEAFENIKKNAEQMGMVVNAAKTQLLCTTTAVNYQVRSFIWADGQKITSGDSLKTVGYTFGRRLGPAEHVRDLRRKFAYRTGIIRHLKKIKEDTKTLTQVYTTFLRPLLEYATSAFHSTLSAEQSDALEKLQRTTLKMIYGFDCPYSQCLEKSGLKRLDERREELMIKFTKKAYASSRFGQRWFEKPEEKKYGLRKESKVVEEFANRDRLRNAPIFRMRRIINSGY